MGEFTHFDGQGNAWMVDVHEKPETYRVARAEGRIYMSAEAFEAIMNQKIKKGDVLGIARVAGIMAAKKNAELIPLCHPLPMTKCEVDFEPDEGSFSIRAVCTTAVVARTGIEMEALTGVSVALLTVYDMCKAIDRSMKITDICLLEKEGGKSGHYIKQDNE